MSSLKLHDSFNSFEEVKNVVQQFSDENLVSFYIRDSKTLQSVVKTKPFRVKNANPDLKYYMIQYSCIYGGKEFKSRGNNLKQTFTMKGGCPVKLFFFLSDDQNSLNLVQMEMNHNHMVSKEIYNRLPKNRKLLQENEKEVCCLKRKPGKEIILCDITSSELLHNLMVPTVRNSSSIVTSFDCSELLQCCKSFDCLELLSLPLML